MTENQRKLWHTRYMKYTAKIKTKSYSFVAIPVNEFYPK